MKEQKQLYEFIGDFQAKFNMKAKDMNMDRLLFRLSLAEEEFHELDTAIATEDPEGVVDALIDQAYIALGTLELLGVDVRKAFLEVHMCNMAKECGIKTDRIYTLAQDDEFDVIKPKDWVGPDHSDNIGNIGEIFNGNHNN